MSLLYRIFLILVLIAIFLFGSKTAEAKTLTTFERIALCESGNNPHAKSKISSASGRFQFIWGSWNHYGRELWGDDFYEKNVWSYKDNTELAQYVFDKYGPDSWNASKACWNK